MSKKRFNADALARKAEAMAKGGGSDAAYFSQSDIGAETIVRILPNVHENLDFYFAEEKGFWLNNNRFVTKDTFGKPCKIWNHMESYTKSNDKSIKGLLNDSQFYSRKTTYLVPILLLEVEYDKKGQPKSFEVIDNEVKVLQCGISLIKAINAILTNRQFQNETEDGPLDRELGYNIILSKKGKKLKTEYSASPMIHPMEMDEEYYTPEAIPNLMELMKAKLMEPAEAIAKIDAAILGEDAEDDDEEEDEDDEAPAKKSTKKTTSKKVVDDDEEEDDEEEAPKGKKALKFKKDADDDEYDIPKKKSTKKIADDDDEEEEEEEEEAPKKKSPKGITKKKVIEDDEDEEEDEEDFVPKKKVIKKK